MTTIRDRLARMISFAVALAMALGMTAAFAQQRIVNVYNWADYIDPTVLEAFTKETGIAVKYDIFDSNDTLETKLLAGKSGYDVVLPTSYFLDRQVKAGLFYKLDFSKLPNRGNIWPEIAKRLSVYDPGNAHAVNYMWGTTGIGYNVAKARAILGPDSRLDSWDFIFKPELIAKFKDCGIDFLDSSNEIVSAALHYLNIDAETRKPADFNKAFALLQQIRPYIRKFHSSEIINALASGEICLAVGWSGDIKQARKRAIEAKNGVDVDYVIPKEGALMWFDNFAIPKDAPHVAEALEFINFMLRKDIAARNSNFLGYANGNSASQPLVDKAVIEDKTIYPDEATMRKLYNISAYDPKTQRLVNRLWTRLKTGQ